MLNSTIDISNTVSSTSSLNQVGIDTKISDTVKYRIKQHKQIAIIKHSKRSDTCGSNFSNKLVNSLPNNSASNIAITTTNQDTDNKLKILQININGIRNKINELNLLISKTKPDVITIQESKLTADSKTPFINGYTPSRKDQDRVLNKGGGLLTYISSKLTFSEI
jgi:glutaredoxin-related protein